MVDGEYSERMEGMSGGLSVRDVRGECDGVSVRAMSLSTRGYECEEGHMPEIWELSKLLMTYLLLYMCRHS